MNSNNFQSSAFFNLSGFRHKEIFSDLDYVWEVLPRINSFIISQFEKGILKANYKDKQFVYVGDGTKIHESVEIEGPAIIGNNCTITQASYLRENCLIGNSVIIGHAAEIKNTVMLNKSSASHFNYIGDSIIGNNVNMSGGSITANVRLDKKSIRIKSEDQIIDSKLLKFGAIVGDESKVGVNAVLNPGTILGRKSIVYPLTSVKGVHIDNEIIKK